MIDPKLLRQDTEAVAANLIGDVKDKDCFIMDDEVSTGGSMIEASQTLKEAGAKDLYAGCTHGILCGDAGKRIEKSEIKEFVTTNTIDQSSLSDFSKLKVINVSHLFSDAIAAIHMGTSVSKLFI